MNWTVLVARRFLKQRQRRGEGIITFLPILGIALGIVTLVTVIGIMNGFQLGFIENIIEVSSYHVQIPATLQTYQDISAKAEKSDLTKSAVPIRDSFSLLGSDSGRIKGASIRGIDINRADRDDGFKSKLSILYGDFLTKDKGEICIGHHLARSLGVLPGDTVRMTGTGSAAGAVSIMPVSYDFAVSGIFETGYFEYDSNLAFVSLGSFAELFPGREYCVVGVKLDNKNKAEQFIRWWDERNGSVPALRSWKEINSSFFSALAVEKLMMILVVSLIFLVVSINLYHSIRRSILERREDYGTLKALGASTYDLQKIVIFEGSIIGLFGTVIGAPLSLLLAGNINRVLGRIEDAVFIASSFVTTVFPDIHMYPSLMFFSSYPVRVLPHEYIISLGFGLLAPIAGAYIASRDVLKLYPVEVLHYE